MLQKYFQKIFRKVLQESYTKFYVDSACVEIETEDLKNEIRRLKATNTELYNSLKDIEKYSKNLLDAVSIISKLNENYLKEIENNNFNAPTAEDFVKLVREIFTRKCDEYFRTDAANKIANKAKQTKRKK